MDNLTRWGIIIGIITGIIMLFIALIALFIQIIDSEKFKNMFKSKYSKMEEHEIKEIETDDFDLDLDLDLDSDDSGKLPLGEPDPRLLMVNSPNLNIVSKFDQLNESEKIDKFAELTHKISCMSSLLEGKKFKQALASPDDIEHIKLIEDSYETATQIAQLEKDRHILAAQLGIKLKN